MAAGIHAASCSVGVASTLALIRFHGVLAPNSKLRAAIVQGPAHSTSTHAADHVRGASARMSWACMLKRIFDIGVGRCPHCGGDLKIIAAIEEPAMIAEILTHLGLPARRFELFRAA